MKEIIDKINKLLAVAENSAATKEESAAFLSKAYKLMLEHKIESHQLHQEENTIIVDSKPLNLEDILAGKSTVNLWKSALATMLSRNFGCFIVKSKKYLILTGKKQDIENVRYFYNLCILEIIKLCFKCCKGNGKRYTNSFRFGCIKSIHDSIEFEKTQLAKEFTESNNQTGLMVLSNMLAEVTNARNEFLDFMNKNEAKKPKLTSSAVKPKVCPIGYSNGVSEGKDIYNNVKKTKENNSLGENNG